MNQYLSVYYIIPALLVLGCVTVVAVLYARKIPKLFTLDLDAMAQHRQLVRKKTLLENRLARKFITIKSVTKKIIVPVLHFFEHFFKAIYQRLRHLEDDYKKAASISVRAIKPGEAKQSIEPLLQQATVLLKDAKYIEAEKKYIAAIALNHSSLEAYQGLADVYKKLKDNVHALETLRFVVQLNPNSESSWQDLGEIYRAGNKPEDALDAYEQALAITPNNPKNLDACIELALMNKLKFKAQSNLDKLKSVNPENQKLAEYQKQIDAL